MAKKILVAVAWPYVNGDIHVGHLAGYLIPSDIMARFQRLNGSDVLMVSGADCHGTPITIEADKNNKTPAEIVEYYHKKDLELFRKYNLSYNLYTKTTTQNHAKVVQELFMKLMRNGFIKIDTQKQFFSQEDQKFLPDRYVEGTCPFCDTPEQRSDQCENCGRMIEQGAIKNPVSKLTGKEVTLKDTQHYYIDLSGLQSHVKDYLKNKEGIWKNWVHAEAQGWLKEGLKARAITRDLDWGVEIPFDRIEKEFPQLLLDRREGKKFYVWFDAVIGYYSASIEWGDRLGGLNKNEDVIYNKFEGQEDNWEEWWKGDDIFHYYFMGQDNVVFHTIMWPAQLIGSDDKLHLPDIVAANKFMNFDGKKFSKSRNHIIDSGEIADEFGVDTVRFYIAANLPENKEGNFTWNGFEETINNELVANIGNFINRTLVFLQNKFEGKVYGSIETIDNEVKSQIQNTFDSTAIYFEKTEFTNALNEIMKLSSFGNKLFNDSEIWNVIKNDQDSAQKIIFSLTQIVVSLSILIEPFMPDSSKKLRELLSLDDLNPVVGINKWKFSPVEEITLSQKVSILFQKVDTTKKSVQKRADEIKKILSEVIISRVDEVEKHPNADKLSVLNIFDGKEYQKVVTGAMNIKVGDFVPYLGVGKVLPGAFIKDNKKITLSKKELRGVMSYGMVLAEDEIGISDDHNDVMIIQTEDEKIGKSLVEIMDLSSLYALDK